MKVKLRIIALILCDILIINLSFVLAYMVKIDFRFSFFTAELLHSCGHVMAANVIVKLFIFKLFRLYSSLWNYAGIHEMMWIAVAGFAGNAVMLPYLLVNRIGIPIGVLIIATLTDIFFVGGVRFAYRVLRRIKKLYFGRSGSKLKRVLVVGNGAAGAAVIRELLIHPEYNCIPSAIVDDDAAKLGRKINGVPILGKIKDISDVVENRGIDEIIITLPALKSGSIGNVYEECSKTGCRTKVLSQTFSLSGEPGAGGSIRDISLEDLLGREPVKLDMASISSCLNNQVILVTGGGGSIGSELCRQIALFKPRQLIILDNYENNAFYIQNELAFKFPELNLVLLIANIRDKQRLEHILSRYKPDVVFHAAAHKHVTLMEENPDEAVKNNVLGTLNVVECSRASGVKKFVLISTDKAVNPTSVMGATKRIAELVLQSYNRISSTEFVSVRFGNVLGSSGSVVPLFKQQIAQGGPVKVTHPDITRYFMTITEAVQLVIEAAAIAKGGEIFVLDMGKPVRILDLAKNLIELSGYKPGIDIEIEYTGLRTGEKLYEELVMAEEELTATANKKIFVLKSQAPEWNMLMDKIHTFECLNMNDKDGVLSLIKELVPNYDAHGQ